MLTVGIYTTISVNKSREHTPQKASQPCSCQHALPRQVPGNAGMTNTSIMSPPDGLGTTLVGLLYFKLNVKVENR